MTLTAKLTEVDYNKAYTTGGALTVMNPSLSTSTGTIKFDQCATLETNLAKGKGGFAYFDNEYISL